MTSTNRHEAQSPARSEDVAAMDGPITAQIRGEVAGWEGVTVEPHRFGGMPHHILPESGWVSFAIRDASDVPAVIALFRLNFERPWRSGEATPD